MKNSQKAPIPSLADATRLPEVTTKPIPVPAPEPAPGIIPAPPVAA